MKRRVSKNSISLARTLGVAGLLAVAWLRPLDAARQTITRRQFRSPILTTRRKRARFAARWSIQSPASRYMIRRMTMAGRSPLFAGTPSTTEPQIPLPLEATLRPIRISRCFMRSCRRFAGRFLLFARLAPGGECDGVSIFELNDMSPVEIKINGTSAGSNSLDQTFELE